MVLLSDGGGDCEKLLCNALIFNYRNPQSPVPYDQFSKFTLLNYAFPPLRLNYSRQDATHHALARKEMN